MELYGQDAELRLLATLVARLDERSMIDVGAEQGSLSEGMLRAGIQRLHAIDPHPDNARALHARFDTDRRVEVHELAVGDADGSAELHVSSSPEGQQLSFGHTLLEREDTDEIIWTEAIDVTLRSLDSLISEGKLPRRVGILKIDTEGNDLAVVRGMGALDADVVMVEHWSDLPNGLGRCPWTAQELLLELEPRGFTHFAFVVHHGEFVTLKWDDGEIEQGAMGNLVFLHERVLPRLLFDFLDFAGRLAEEAVRVGQRYASAATQRLTLVNELEGIAVDRLAVIAELEQAAQERLVALEATTARMNLQASELDALRRPEAAP